MTRTYWVESNYWEELGEKIKKLSNTQWLLVGAASSAVLFLLLLLQTSGQGSQHYDLSLTPYEPEMFHSKSSGMLAKRTLFLEGNINSTRIFMLRRCPQLTVVEESKDERPLDVRHRGKKQENFELQPGSVIDFSLTDADGTIDIHVFDGWTDEKDYERHPADTSSALFSGTADVGKDIHYQLKANTADTYVFLFQGKSGNAAKTSYKTSRSNYDLGDSKPEDTTGCQYNQCRLKIRKGGCIAIESVGAGNRGTSIKVTLDVNVHHFFTFVVALLPLVAVLVFIKVTTDSSSSSSGGAVRHTAGYDLVDGNDMY
jgi:hypothetical protein